MDVNTLYNFIKKEKELLSSLGINYFYEDIQYGDRYLNEHGGQFIIKMHGEEYYLGVSIITEDADDWGQAEAHESNWCQNSKQDNISPDLIYELIVNFKSDQRENKISSIIK